MNIHRFSCLFVAFFTCHFIAVSALVTQSTILEITEKMDKLRNKITDPQVSCSGEVMCTESRSSAADALTEIGEFLSSKLNESLKKQPTLSKKYKKKNSVKCQTMRTEFESFTLSASEFFYAVQAKKKLSFELDVLNQMWKKKRLSLTTRSVLHKSDDELIHEKLVTLQKLWASRKYNSQNRSFIEQQQSLYGATNCFSSDPDDILIKNLAVNRYINSLIGLFR